MTDDSFMNLSVVLGYLGWGALEDCQEMWRHFRDAAEKHHVREDKNKFCAFGFVLMLYFTVVSPAEPTVNFGL